MVRYFVTGQWTKGTTEIICVHNALGKSRSDTEKSSVRDEEEEDWKENLCFDESTMVEWWLTYFDTLQMTMTTYLYLTTMTTTKSFEILICLHNYYT